MQRPLRFITAASLFDGHDVSINIMRRMLQAHGAEVIHLGHNRSAQEVVTAAIQEDAHAIALSSYQGGHVEYFKYVRQLLNEQGATNVRIFGGGGGVIIPSEIELLHQSGITRIYSPADGQKMGLVGIIQDMVQRAQHDTLATKAVSSHGAFAKEISAIELGSFKGRIGEKKAVVLGVTGTGGAGKSSLIDELLLRFHKYCPKIKIALLSIDPTKSKTKGALLGDRIRLNSANYGSFYIRSMATRDSNSEIAPSTKEVVSLLASKEFDLVIVETSGIGQSSAAIIKISDKSLYVMTPEYGAASQLEKIEMLDYADFVAINKFEKPRSEDAYRDVVKQYMRNHLKFNPQEKDLAPVFATMASRFNDPGINSLFSEIVKMFNMSLTSVSDLKGCKFQENKQAIIPVAKMNYLRSIASTCQEYDASGEEQAIKVEQVDALEKTLNILTSKKIEADNVMQQLKQSKAEILPETMKRLEEFNSIATQYRSGHYHYEVRGKKINVATKYESLSGLQIPRVAIPPLTSKADTFRFISKSNLPGLFPYAAGIFPFKRKDEDPKRMFAGEGGPSRTNRRFHYLSKNDPFKRLSTAFDSVTLYGEDPDKRPDIYGKIGESGVSIATLDDMQSLFDGFDLSDPKTSVSMTINGPAPIILAMFMNTAVMQKHGKSSNLPIEKKIEIMRQVRGTVQADILKEDQAQNTCIFSLDFALKMMGDVQEFFSKNKIQNYYTVSISGYHIAEAGANPITQLAFTLANGFTYLEYYLSRGLHVDDICPNLSFFFSNGLDPEYTVIGSVARKIWAVTMRDKYGAGAKSQQFKYHVQTSGRSLHAQEIDFNDIRTTLQAFLALSDNCNSLHTNAYDEAITTPTEESVRRAMAVQMIINKEFGLNKTDNPLQGSFVFQEMCDLVEKAVLKEFERISDKGGVLGAMEVQYQRSKIQEESLYYETLKDNGTLPIIGVNTYLSEHAKSQEVAAITRASYEEKDAQISRLKAFHQKNNERSLTALQRLSEVALSGGNIFEELLETVNYCSLGQISKVLYQVGGSYRRNM